MPDVLIGDRATHPSLRLAAGQVADFAEPPADAICPICGHEYGDTDWHPAGASGSENQLTFGGDNVTFGGDNVTFGG